MKSQEILDTCLIPGKALLGDRGGKIEAWALLCAIGWQTTGFKELPNRYKAVSLFFIPGADVRPFLTHRRHQIAPIEQALGLKIKDTMDLRRLCRANPALAAALGYLNITYYVPHLPQENRWDDAWECFKRLMPKSVIREGYIGTPVDWVVSHGAGWKLARRLFDHGDVD